jgi:hypothetical protein
MVGPNGEYRSTRKRLGKLPAQPARPQLRLARLTTTLPAPPPTIDFFSDVADWPMYGNDQYGDCVEAGTGHHVEQITRYGQGTLVEVTDLDVLHMYSAVTGFDPMDPNTDQGTLVQDALAWWRKGSGLAGHAIVAYASVDPSNAIEVKQAIATFGAVGIGFNFPAYAMTQFDAGRPWDVQKANAAIEGGHYVLVVGYDGTYFYVVTWGAIQRMTPAFFRKYVDEAWVVIDDEMVSTLSVFDADLHGFGEEFADLTGQPNPFPGSNPTPAPVPAGPTVAMVAAAVREALTNLGV